MAKIVRSSAVTANVLMPGVRMRCPACRANGNFEPILQYDAATQTGEILGLRRCPNPTCSALVFFVRDRAGALQSFPAERIDFDTKDIPQGVHDAFEEAVTCHAEQCFVAAAIMVRKTLELICHDRGATGANLKERLAALRSKVILPTELFDGLDYLRLLGNDAAHIESQIFDQVGEQEVEASIEFTKEVLKATYQLKGLVEKIRALKKTP